MFRDDSRPATPAVDDYAEDNPDDFDEEDADAHELQMEMEALGLDPRAYQSNALNPLSGTSGSSRQSSPEGEMNAETRNGFPSTSKVVSTKFFTGAARIYRDMKGMTFTEKFAQDRLRVVKEGDDGKNIYYPLKDYEEWEFMNVLMRMKCSLEEKTALLNTKLVSLSPLPFFHLY